MGLASSLTFLLLLHQQPSAHAASFDLPEVGGLHGTPATDGPAAVWWNPATMSGASGTRALVEVAPVIGGRDLERSGPVNAGDDAWRVTTAIPFVGVVTDAGVDGLGLGLALSVPYALSGTSVHAPGRGPGSTHLREGSLRALHLTGALSFAVTRHFGVGIGGSYVHATYRSVTDHVILPDLRDAIGEVAGDGLVPAYTVEQTEDPDYLARIELGTLTGHSGAVHLGLFVEPVRAWRLSLSLYSGTTVRHEGEVDIRFACPPEADTVGRLGAVSQGICDAHVRGRGSNTYAYPMRLNAGLRWARGDGTTVELMGGWVRFSRYEDFLFTISDLRKLNEGDASPNAITPLARRLMERDRAWARGNHDSFWIGADAKVRAHDLVAVHLRAVFDRHAVPDAFMSPNNADADTVRLGAGVEVRAGALPLWVGASFLEAVHLPRTVDENAFRIDIEPADRVEDRRFWPTMNGRYTGFLHRVGLSLRTEFGGHR